MSDCHIMCFKEEVKEGTLLKWKVRPGSRVSQGTVLLLYKDLEHAEEELGIKSEARKLKSTMVGTVKSLLKKDGDKIKEGCDLLSLELGCSHSVVMKDMCAECGADLRESNHNDQVATASIPMVHSVPELVVSQEQAQILGKADEERLILNRKLVLLVDLDQTLVHTTNDDIPPNLKDVYHFQMYGAKSQWYHVRLRPGTKQFLEKISNLYELHICTFGARLYAHVITKFLDQDGRYFSHRILSRDECFNPNTKIANLKALFPCGDHLVCIIDDREDVWNFSPNLVHVKPYHFFQHTGDINAPPGLAKTEQDSTDNFLVGSVKIQSKKEEKRTKDSRLDQNVTGNCVTATAMEYLPTTSEETESFVSVSHSEAKDKIKSDVKIGTTDQLPEETGSDILPVGDVCPSNDDSATAVQAEDLVKHQTECDSKENKEIDVDDEDDYLLYLTDILIKIHTAFYKLLDAMREQGTSNVPDLKNIVPRLRQSVLSGVNIVFSGVIPTNMPVENSRLYHVAKSLGASIQSRLIPQGDDIKNATTHVVAARMGTIKVSEAKKLPGIHIVTPDWLWCCTERWERVDERLFPLTKLTVPVEPKSAKNPFHDRPQSMPKESCTKTSYPDHAATSSAFATYDPVTGKRIRHFHRQNGKSNVTVRAQPATETISAPRSSGSAEDSRQDGPQASSSPTNFASSINPFLAFSTQDIADMDREVEDILDGSDSEVSGEEEKEAPEKTPAKEEEESSSEENLNEDCPRGWRKRKDLGEREIHSKFPRSDLPCDSDRSVVDSDSECGESIGSVDEEMAAAVEREFLGF